MPYKVIKQWLGSWILFHDLDKGNLEKELPFHNEH